MSQHDRNAAHSSSKLTETRDGMNKVWKTWWESEDVYSEISSEHKLTKNLMITKFPNTISSGKILYRYLFSYSFLTGHLSLCTDTHFHSPLLVYRGKNVQRVKRKSTETSLIIKLYVFHKHPVRLPLTTCTSPSTITRIVNTHFYQYIDHIPTVPLRKICCRSRWRTWNPRKMK